MKLSSYVLSLFFGSDEGSALVVGFEELLGLSTPDEGDGDQDEVTSFRGLEDAIGKRSSLWKKGREHDAGG